MRDEREDDGVRMRGEDANRLWVGDVGEEKVWVERGRDVAGSGAEADR